MTQDKLLPCLSSFDPTKEENWQYHDEYEFWYIGFPELNEEVRNGNERYEPSRERGFKPWENISTPAAPDAEALEALKREAMEELGCFDKGPSVMPQWDKGYDAGAEGMFNLLSKRPLQSQAPSVDDAVLMEAIKSIESWNSRRQIYAVTAVPLSSEIDLVIKTIRALLSGTAKKVGDGE